MYLLFYGKSLIIFDIRLGQTQFYSNFYLLSFYTILIITYNIFYWFGFFV